MRKASFKKGIIYSLLSLIFLAGLFLRVYKLDKIPPSLNWDEVDAGYNAYTIWHWGKDEWGKTLPLVFKSFNDDKHPVHIYFTAPWVGLFGLSDLSARLPTAILSSLGIIVIFFLVNKMFHNPSAALFSSFFLAISPYHIHFSRGLWELNYALFFLLLGLALFYYALDKRQYFLLSFFSFGLSLYSYHSSKVVVPLVLLTIILLNLKKISFKSKYFIIGSLIFGIFLVGFIFEPRLLGLARIKQTSFQQSEFADTLLFKKTNNATLGKIELALRNYPKYFSYNYLFNKGDQTSRNSVKIIGQFYKFDLILIIAGIAYLVYYSIRYKKKEILLLIIWLLAVPLPAATASRETNAARAIFMLGVFQIFCGFGAYAIYNVFKNNLLKSVLLLIIITISIVEFSKYANYYFNKYSEDNAIEWQYGWKQIAINSAKKRFAQVFTTADRQQPYIFFLFYQKYPLPKFLESVVYNESITKSYNSVLQFDKYHFDGWNTVDSLPASDVLYNLTPSQYDGLRFRDNFYIEKLIKFPSGADAYFEVVGY